MISIGMFRPTHPAARGVVAAFLGSALFCAAPDAAAMYCGDPNDDDVRTALDALVVLRGAVGLGGACDRNCECDVDFNRELTTNDALIILNAAVGHDVYWGCGFADECFNDEDCDAGFYCGTDPEWSCDAACVPEATTTTEAGIEDCFSDDDCAGVDPDTAHCCAYTCSQCENDSHCPSGQYCDGACACVPLPSTTTDTSEDECFDDDECVAMYGPGFVCGGPDGFSCVTCNGDEDCPSGQECAEYLCYPTAP